ncbi:cyclophilin-like fold protein [Methanobacterium alcaliphilum]|uniref:cyclophilin-like fold protein n=1 Tax=Methanobacterium alcaliphilum TaxID=392018 RepID=UPI00200A8AE7|nr:cyclophilin-like fold protein [Methanobacterium alcaliphilum]MCK9150887.1 cyclophilin-like fold protein [Methanobacterium alcaliphilum]
MKIGIEVENKGMAIAELDHRNPKTAQEIYKNLPIEGRGLLWLEEVYFDIPLTLEYENPSKSAEMADISYWPPGYAFCIFFGSTPPYSEVNHIGKIVENIEVFRNLSEGDRIIIKKIEE